MAIAKAVSVVDCNTGGMPGVAPAAVHAMQNLSTNQVLGAADSDALSHQLQQGKVAFASTEASHDQPLGVSTNGRGETPASNSPEIP